MALKTVYFFTLITGGTAAALDSVDGNSLVDGDVAFVMYNATLYAYLLDADSGAAESSPSVISPDTNAGTKRWIRQVTGSGVVDGQDWGTAAPTTGTWARGWIRWNTLPVAGGNAGWICVTAGPPGTWKQWGVINA